RPLPDRHHCGVPRRARGAWRGCGTRSAERSWMEIAMTYPTDSIPRQLHGAPFHRILCAVDGSVESAAGLEHAIALAGGDATITIAAVWWPGSPLLRGAWDVVDEAVSIACAAGA